MRRVPVWCLVLVAFALRALPLTRESLWRDEVDTLRFALGPPADLIANFTRPGANGPLYHVIMRGWLTLGGAEDLTLRAFSALCGALGVALVFDLTRRLFGRRAAWLAGVLMAASPVMIWYSGEGKMYAAVVVLALAAACALRAAVAGRRAGWVAFVAAASAGFYMHLLFAAFVPVALVCWLAWSRGRGRRTAAAAFACLTVPYLPLAAWMAPSWLAGFDTGHPAYPLGTALFTLGYNWSLGLGDSGSLGMDWRWSVAAMAVFAVLAAAGAARVGARALPWLAWLTLPTALVLLISLRAPVFEPRYVLWSAPALYILAGASVAPPGGWGPLRAMGALMAVILSGLGLIAQLAQPIRPDARAAAAFVRERAQPGDAFVFQMPYARHAFDHYWRGEVAGPRLDGPFTNDGAAPEDIGAELRSATTLATGVWLIEIEPELWDRRGLARAWLQQNAAQTEAFERWGVTAARFGDPAASRLFFPLLAAPPRP